MRRGEHFIKPIIRDLEITLVHGFVSLSLPGIPEFEVLGAQASPFLFFERVRDVFCNSRRVKGWKGLG